MTNQIIPYGDGSGGMVTSVTDETLSSQDLLEVRAGGTALHTTVNSGGALETESGGVVSGTTINDGGNNNVTGGGTAYASIVNAGGEEDVTGGTASGTIVSSGGYQSSFVGDQYNSAGRTVGTIVSNGGVLDDNGIADTTMIMAGGMTSVYDGGVSFGTQIQFGGTEYLQGTGIASGTVVSDGGTQVLAALKGVETAYSDGAIVSQAVRSGASLDLTLSGSLIEAVTSNADSTVTVTIYGTGSNTGSQTTVTLSSGTFYDQFNDLFQSPHATSTHVLSGGTLVLAGGSTDGLVVDAGGRIVVGGYFDLGPGPSQQVTSGNVTGETISAVTITNGVTLTVSSGNATTGTTVLAFGSETILSGATATATTISSGGLGTVSSGAIVSGDVVLGTLTIAGGSSVSGTVSGGGQIVVAAGSATATQINTSGSLTVAAGASVADSMIGAGGTETNAGGTDADATVQAGGNLVISAGSATIATIQAGGTETVLSGAVDAGALILGSQVITGGRAVDGFVKAGGSATALAGGVVTDTTVLGTLTLQGSGSSVSGMLSAGGQAVLSGGTASGLVIYAGGTETIFAGLDKTAQVNGTQILSGGSAVSAGVASGGQQIVRSGGTVISAAVLGQNLVSAGGVTSMVLTTSGGVQTVFASGTATSSFVAVAGRLVLSAGGTASAAQVTSGGMVTVTSGGIVSGNIIANGGVQVVSAGAVDSNTQVTDNGIERVMAGAVASRTVLIYSGGVTVSSGGTTSTVAGGFQLVSSGGSAVQTQNSGGTLRVLDGGTAISAAIGSQEIVYAGGTDIGATITPGLGQGLAASQTVSGGNVSNATVSAGGYQVVLGGNVTGTTVSSGGTLSLTAGTLTGISILSGGLAFISAAESAMTISGATIIVSGGIASGDTLVGTGVMRYDPSIGDAGTQAISSGSVASGTMASAFGQQLVLSGGRAVGTVLTTGADQIVYSGGGVSNTVLSSGAVQAVFSGGLETGSIISGGGRLALQDASGAAEPVVFAGSGGVLELDFVPVVPFAATGFVAGDKIDLGLGSYSSASTVSAAGDLVTVNANGATITLDLVGTAGAAFQLTSATAGSNVYTELSEVACYAAGTRIRTPSGESDVATLAPDDIVVTASGRQCPIKWIGHRIVDCRRHPEPEKVWPIQILAGAFGPQTPDRDLFLSPDHAVFAQGVLIPVKHLINGASITQVERGEIAYFHIELDQHDVILADNLPCESYLDNGSRSAFANGGAVLQLHPDFSPAERCEAVGETLGYAPLRIIGAEVEHVRAKLQRRAARLDLAKPRRNQVPPPIAAAVADPALLLQPDWYLATQGDVAAAGADPAVHYAAYGRQEGRLPCSETDLLRGLGLIDPATIVRSMPDVVAARVDPVAHFCIHGWREGRRPNAYFNTNWYSATYIVPNGMNPLVHYVLQGETAGLMPSPHFDPAWYRDHYGLGNAVCALAHYLTHRRTQRFSPLPSFDVVSYVKAHAATLRQSRDPYAHYLAIGRVAAQGLRAAA